MEILIVNESSDNMNKDRRITDVVDVNQFLNNNLSYSAQEIIINLYKLDDVSRNILLCDNEGILKNKILSLLVGSDFDKYVFILENYSMSEFFNRYGKDFVLSLDLDRQYELLNSDLPSDSIVNVVPNMKKEVINYFFERDKRAIYLYDKFNIPLLIKRGIKFSDDILKKKEFFDLLKDSSFMNFRKNINDVEKFNNPIIIEGRLEEYYEELLGNYNSNSGLFKEYKDVLNDLELVFDEDIPDTFIMDEEIKSLVRSNIQILDDGGLVIADKDNLIQLLRNETSKKISEIVIDSIFRDNIYNVWINLKEMLRYNELLPDDEKILDNDKIKFYNMILEFDYVSSSDKIALYKCFKNRNFNLSFYQDLRNIKDKAYDKIREDIFKPLEYTQFINDEYSNKFGVNVYDLRDRNYTMLVRVLSSEFRSKGHHSKDCYSLISDENNFVIREGDVNAILYGYSSFDNDMVLHMFESDAFSLMSVDNKLVNRIMTSRELASSNASYSEVQLLNKKISDAKHMYDILKPDFIVSFDKINEREVNESKRLGVPLVLIKRVRIKNDDKSHSSFDLEIDSYDSYENIKKNLR